MCLTNSGSDSLLHSTSHAHKRGNYLPTSAHHKIAATVLFHLVLALGAGLGVGVQPVCCLTVIAALALPLLPPRGIASRPLPSGHAVHTHTKPQLLCIVHGADETVLMHRNAPRSWTPTGRALGTWLELYALESRLTCHRCKGNGGPGRTESRT